MPDRAIAAFVNGAPLDLRQEADRDLPADLLRSLLLGGQPPQAGTAARLEIVGARIVGVLDLAHSDIGYPIRLHHCEFTDQIRIGGARLRQVSLDASSFPGLDASQCFVEGSFSLRDCRSTATVDLAGSRIDGALWLNGANLSDDEIALAGTHLTVSGDIVARDGFVCHGMVRLNDATVGGAVRWEGAQLINPGKIALHAPDLKVGAIANLCDGFTVEGRISLGHARITTSLCFENANLSETDGQSLNLRYIQTDAITMLPALPIPGEVDLRHARIGLLRDDPATWPETLRLYGFRYDALDAPGAAEQRLPWLSRDAAGYQPQPYEQLAEVYGRAGHDHDARVILLANQRQRRATLWWLPRIWGYLQDVTVGYGYRPGRAATVMASLAAIGTVVFTLWPPLPLTDRATPEFNSFIYTLDLLVPLVEFGQEQAFHPSGTASWLAYTLIASGWILATTIAAAAARALRRT